jgi:hypothetical protein
VLKCSDGHLFTTRPWKLVFLTMHLGADGWLRCPVDHKWRIAEKVSQFHFDALPEAERHEALRHRY